MKNKEILIICSAIIIISCLMGSFLIISNNNSGNEISESEYQPIDTTESEIHEDANYREYAPDWYESYHIGGRYHGPHNPEFIETYDLLGLTQAPDGTYIIVAGDGCYYYVD